MMEDSEKKTGDAAKAAADGGTYSLNADGPQKNRPATSAPPAPWTQSNIDTPVGSRPGSRLRKKSVGGDFWALMGCNLIVFVGSVCIMVLELNASRLIAKHVGSSLYTWTSVIGVVLAGITLGNYLGGWLADRFENRMRTLGWLFLISSALAASVLFVDRLVMSMDRYDLSRALGMAEGHDLSWPAWVLVTVALIFLLPSVALGTISPVTASIALSRSSKTGITVGNVYAWGALGSIIGTFLTGFWLIDAFGTRAVIGMVAGTLAVMGVLVAGGQWAFRAAVVFGWVQFLAFLTAASVATAGMGQHMGAGVGNMMAWGKKDADAREATVHRWKRRGEHIGELLHQFGLELELRDDRPGGYRDESNYSYIYVGEQDEDGDLVKYLKLDKLEHSYFNPQNPTALYYDYEKVYAAVTERSAELWDANEEVPQKVSTLFIGGGGFVFPRWIEAKFPGGSRIDVAELDPAVKLAVQREMGLPPDDKTRVHTIIGDARNVVEDLLRKNARLKAEGKEPVTYDFIYGDAFNDFSVPWHLTTKEFDEKVHKLLHPERGLFLANIIDIYPRSEYPTEDDRERGAVITDEVPDVLLPEEWSEYNDWHQSAAPFDCVELRRHEDDDAIVFSYRGEMSPAMRDQLIGLAPDSRAFRTAVEAVYRRSRQQQQGRFLGRYVKTLAAVFPNVYVFTSQTGTTPFEERETWVVVAAMQPLDLSDLKYGTYPTGWSGAPFATYETDPAKGEVSFNSQMDSILALSQGLLLTDDFAPVDNLLIPVFTQQN